MILLGSFVVVFLVVKKEKVCVQGVATLLAVREIKAAVRRVGKQDVL